MSALSLSTPSSISVSLAAPAWRPLLGGAGLALLWLGSARIAQDLWGQEVVQGLLQTTGGLALVLLLDRGARYGVGLALGGLIGLALGPAATWGVSAAELLAWAVHAGLGAALLRLRSIDLEHCSLASCRQLLVYAGGWAAGAGALAGSAALLAMGAWSAADWPAQWLRWWGGSALGTVLVVPLLLSWRPVWRRGLAWHRVSEGLLVYALAFAVGQVVFMGWMGDVLRPLAHAYWLFLFVAWAGVRLGMAGTTGLLCLVAAQAGWGALQGRGFFAQDLKGSAGLGYVAYVMILSLVGMMLASYLDMLRRQKADARVAAIAFECQEGLLITDAQGVVLRANRSFLALSGYAAHEVLGRAAQILCANGCARGGGDESPPPWPALQRQEWHRRKSGEHYPVWFTRTPVMDSQRRVTHYVLTLTDLSDWRRQQAQRRRREQAHRDALVREVHHRIKNNLQGITGILQTLGQRHPSLRDPLTEVTGQVQSIAVLHGLQGRSHADQVWLCELVREVAAGVGALWGVAIVVQAPASAQELPCRLHPSETVPLALIVHELLLNAVKHGGRQHQDVRVELRTGPGEQEVCLAISNPGYWPAQGHAGAQVGLGLVAALMPRSGAALSLEQTGDRALALLRLQAPVLQFECHEAMEEDHGQQR